MTRDPAAEQQAQRNCELSAVTVLQQDANPVAVLNLYVKKTKAATKETVYNVGTPLQWTYQTLLRDIRVEGDGQKKKAARTQCAANLLAELRQIQAITVRDQ